MFPYYSRSTSLVSRRRRGRHGEEGE